MQFESTGNTCNLPVVAFSTNCTFRSNIINVKTTAVESKAVGPQGLNVQVC